ncbi:AAA family ATPase [Terriglobus sp.]|uniref:AAA family ATPase n=1 Tax=Terriglobus sp. TaxID=1889013 RepID=UPI003B00B46D
MREGTRNWMREKMRRRSKRGPNNSEATGKIGQEIPVDQPAALRPSYPEVSARSDSGERDAAEMLDAVTAAGSDAPETAADQQPGAIVMETQPESLATPPAEPQPVGAGEGDKPQPKGYVVLAIGLPGSGKTTWYKRRGVTPLSSDMLRTILFDDITDQRYSGLVFSTLRSLLRARLIAKMPWNYVDATNLSAHERRQWIKMARSFGYEAQAVYFEVPLSVCMERNSRRDRRVADDVMEKMAERLRPPSFREGFSKITVVRVKGQPGSTTAAAIPTAESFNAPVPADTEEDTMAKPIDEPNGRFDDAAEGRAAHLADRPSSEGRESTLGHSDKNDDLDEPSGRLDTLGGDGASSAHDAADVEADRDDQPDTYE